MSFIILLMVEFLDADSKNSTVTTEFKELVGESADIGVAFS